MRFHSAEMRRREVKRRRGSDVLSQIVADTSILVTSGSFGSCLIFKRLTLL